MKGLIKNSIYGAMGSAYILFAFFAIFGIVVMITANSTLLLIFSITCVTGFAFNALSAFRKEAATNWRKYVITLPIRRRDIVKSRYIHHLIWVFVGMVIAVVFIVLTILIHGNLFFNDKIRDPFAIFWIDIGIPLLMGSVFYPLILLVDSDKSEILMVISLIVAVGLTAAFVWIVNMHFGFAPVNLTEFFIGMFIYIGMVSISFFSSYYISLIFINRKEY